MRLNLDYHCIALIAQVYNMRNMQKFRKKIKFNIEPSALP